MRAHHCFKGCDGCDDKRQVSVFTDENLSQLKAGNMYLENGDTEALIARLEAAEAVCEYFSNLIKEGIMPDTVKLGLLTRWRITKSSPKEGDA